jgi:4-hydroxyphenylpyruvate dioxygenase
MDMSLPSSDIHATFFHHVELQSQGARVLASMLSKMLGMPVVATLRSERGVSYCLQSQQAIIVCTSPIDRSCRLVATSEKPGFHATMRPTHGIRVRAIGMNVADIGATRAHLADLLNDADGETLTASEDHLQDVSLPRALGDIGLRFVESELHSVAHVPSGIPRGIPGFPRWQEPFMASPAIAGGIVGIDHIAINVPNVRDVCDRLMPLTGWTFFRQFDEDTLHRPLAATTIQSATKEGLLTIVQPTSASSIFEHTLRAHGGSCVHHIALRCENVLRFAESMSARGLWETMPAPPSQYYREIKSFALDFLSEPEFEQLQRFGMLLDFEKDCGLIQVFLPYLGDVPGVFFELIGRVARRGERSCVPPAPGCGGFGDRNVTELYDCLLRGVDQWPGQMAA